MLDGTFNHSAWDCEIDDMGLQLFPGIAASGADLIRSVRPGWYSRKGNYGLPATYYGSAADNDLAPAPDRTDFGKWNDVADFFFGAYDSLVQGQTADWRDQYLRERDRFDGFADPRTRELWQYFAHYPIYWLEKTGHPAGTPKTESYRGIDGLRCDFAQGLPSAFWEYCINRTRNVKWDFVFMAESLDGYRTVGGSPRHGVGYRSARHFDVLNENLVFYWRDQFFNYFSYAGAKPWTYETWQAFDARRHAYDTAPLLLNLTGHDEILPHDQPWRVVYAYAALSAMDGVPMLVYGQEAGLQNDAAVYTGRGLSASNNFARYEMNFGKSIPHFKRYNHLTNVWNGASAPPKAPLRDAYARIQGARRQSTALRSRQNYFLSRTDTGGYDSNIFAVAKFSAPGVSAATQDVVLCFVNNDVAGSTNRWATFALHAAYGGANWFGIETGHHYNVVDLLSPDPTNYLWETNATGSALIAGGLTVGLTGDPAAGRQAQYLRLVDRTANPGGRLPDQDGDGVEDHADPDDDNDGLPDAWEGAFGPREPQADDDGDGKNNLEEFLSGTRPDDPGSVLRLVRLQPAAGATEVAWTTVSNHNYRLEARHTQAAPESAWQTIQFATARGETEAHAQATASTSLHYRAVHVP